MSTTPARRILLAAIQLANAVRALAAALHHLAFFRVVPL